MEDGENILGEFLLGAVIRVAENHDFAAVLLGHPLDEFKAEPGEAVLVGNHNAELIAAMELLQYGDKSFSPEVEAATDVGNDPGVWIALPHEVNLSLQVVSLFCGTHPTVADRFGGGAASQVGVDVVETLAGGVSVVGDFALVSIGPQGVRMEVKECSCGI